VPPALQFIRCLLFALPLALPVSLLAQPTKKVLFIGIDGTRFDAIERAQTPNLDGLMQEGIHSPTCLILGERYKKNDTVSGPGWSSILTGVWADKHGVQNNGFAGSNYIEFPHFFARLKASRPQARTVSLVTWKPIYDKIVSAADLSLDFPQKERGIPGYDRSDVEATDEAVKQLATGNPDALFLYIGQVDETGHAYGFHPSVPEYIAAIERADALVGRAIAAMRSRPSFAQEDWLVIVTSDHGGKGKGHGGGHNDPDVMNSFLIISGNSARSGRFDEQVYLVDAPVTALAHLGIPLQPEWKLDGRAVGLK
jgi:predicted AlkP superfamily pyrophosphatase or phosphodiesterase